ncbi:MAG TPA: recombinase family protein [Opitutaceae bacterium]
MAVAEFERELIVERTRAGLRTARARGKRLGRKPLNPPLASQAAKLKARGKTNRAIAAELEVSAGSVINLLAASASWNTRRLTRPRDRAPRVDRLMVSRCSTYVAFFIRRRRSRSFTRLRSPSSFNEAIGLGRPKYSVA